MRAKTHIPKRIMVKFDHMKQRCTNPNSKDYNHYGGRGIKLLWANVDDFWVDMKEGYKEGLEIDRENNDGNYEKSNCRWRTHQEQMNNYSRNKRVDYDGRNQTLREWAQERKINYQTFHSRLQRGWGFEKALLRPTEKKHES